MPRNQFSRKSHAGIAMLLLFACAAGGYGLITYGSMQALLLGKPTFFNKSLGLKATPAQAASQQMYIWKDAEGTSHISTNPPPQAENAAALAPVRVTGSATGAGQAAAMPPALAPTMPPTAVPQGQEAASGQVLSATGGGVGLNPQALGGANMQALLGLNGQTLPTALTNSLTARGGILPPAEQQQGLAQQQAKAEHLTALKVQQEKLERRLHRARADNDDSHRKRLQQSLRAVQEEIAQLESQNAAPPLPVGQ